MLDESIVRLVFDDGSYLSQAGFAGDDSPRALIPTIVGKSIDGKEPYVGDEALNNPNGFIQPIKNGLIEDWDAMEKVWFQTFYNELRLKPEDHAVLLTEPPMNPKRNRERMLETMFEVFNVQATYLSVQGLLALYASSLTNGFVVDCGGGGTYAIPAYDGNSLLQGVAKTNIGGQEITKQLAQLLHEKYPENFVKTKDKIEVANDIKEKLGYIAIDYDLELQKDKQLIQKEFTLPDGKHIKIDHEAFKCSEVLFNPSVGNIECSGLADLIHNSIQKIDPFYHKDLYGHIVLTGGSTMLPGFKDRLEKEITKLAPTGLKVHIHCNPERKYLPWIGGSVLASLSSFLQMWITKDQYAETGSGIVQRIY